MTTPNLLVKASIASTKLGVSIRVLRLWDSRGRIDAIRTPGGMRLFDVDGYLAKQVAGVKEKQQTDLLSGPGDAEADGELAEGAGGTPQGDAVERPTEHTASGQLAQIEPWERDVEEMFLAVHKKTVKNDCKFPICFASAAKWIGFTRKDNAKTHLLANFVEHEDFEFSFNKCEENRGAPKARMGRPPEKIFISVDTFKHMCLLAGTRRAKTVRLYYLQLERRLCSGDLTLAADVVRHYDRLKRTQTAVFLESREEDPATVHDLDRHTESTSGGHEHLFGSKDFFDTAEWRAHCEKAEQTEAQAAQLREATLQKSMFIAVHRLERMCNK